LERTEPRLKALDELTIDVRTLSTGAYILIIKSGDLSQKHKIMIH
jgi:hypothetical protein